MPGYVPFAVADQAAVFLTDLQRVLRERGLLARVLVEEGRLPRLRVINPEATTLVEVLSASPREGEWFYWWSWAAPIVEVTHVDRAADRVGRVLAVAAPHAARPARDHTGRGRVLSVP
ncbi:hypothetical protein [Nonomuraea sp. NPDC050540]|uniref:hypothetical protein n=1 Tax=Nonomuraea sp. NPDC050540 TaxID=3364367 RepID=UPI0037B8324A